MWANTESFVGGEGERGGDLEAIHNLWAFKNNANHVKISELTYRQGKLQLGP